MVASVSLDAPEGGCTTNTGRQSAIALPHAQSCRDVRDSCVSFFRTEQRWTDMSSVGVPIRISSEPKSNFDFPQDGIRTRLLARRAAAEPRSNDPTGHRLSNGPPGRGIEEGSSGFESGCNSVELAGAHPGHAESIRAW
jgi:hypothetical protein